MTKQTFQQTFQPILMATLPSWIFVALAILLAIGGALSAESLRAQEIDQAAAKVADLAPNPTTRSAKIPQLIQQLNSLDFEQRELATAQLISQGSSALPPLALQFQNSSTESSWRIKKVIEAIGIQGDEDAFYRSAAILQLLVQTDNQQMAERTSKLQKQWKDSQKKITLKQLEQNGATVKDHGVNQPQTQFGMVLLDSAIAQPQPQPTRSKIKRRAAPSYDQTTKLKKLNEILKNNVSVNRRLVLQNVGTSDGSGPSAQAKAQMDAMNNLALQQAFAIRNGTAADIDLAQVTGGVSVDIGRQWKGDHESFKNIVKIPHLRALTFSNQPIGQQRMSTIKRMDSLIVLKFDDCAFTPTVKKFEWPKSVQALVFSKHKVDRKLIDRCANLSQTRFLSFESCRFDPEAVERLGRFQSLNSLSFKDSEITGEMFDQFQRLRQLNGIQLSGCDFEIADFKEFKSKRRDIQINFVPRAFLGVRGNQTVAGLDTGDCVLTEVISGSGAEAGGLQVGDIIKTINGEAILQFEDLRLHIAQHVQDDVLEIEVRRGRDTKNLKVKLGSYDDAPNF